MKESIQKNLCQIFCPYFKPSKEEDIVCLGFLVVEKLLKKGLEIPFDKKDKKPGTKTQETLIRNLCVSCPFYESDCDFAMEYENRNKSENNPPLSPFKKEGLTKTPPLVKGGEGGLSEKNGYPQPCGGFILLGHLIEKSIIHIDDIKNII